jgi:uncharacterized MAPEG superfamily protein
MTTELTVLALGCLLLLAHVLLAGRYRTRQYGTEWNMGARDEDMPPLDKVAGRLDRARGNYLETFPVAIVALLGLTIADRTSDLTAIAAWVWLAARSVYLPLYWAGIPKVRTLVWGIGFLALLVLLGALLLG